MTPESFHPRPVETLLAMPGPYSQRFAQRLNQLYPDLAKQLHVLPRFDSSIGRRAVATLLEFACQAQNIANIELGRAGLMAIPLDWLLAELPTLARNTLDLSDEWELRRLLEALCLLDRCLLLEFAKEALRSSDSEIREAARDMIGIADGQTEDARRDPRS